MDRLELYRQALPHAITQSRYYRYGSSAREIDTVFYHDDKEDGYPLMTVGWNGKTRVCQIVFFARIKDGKIWIEEDWTEDGLTEELVAAGVLREDIVLAFHPPHLRQYTEYAAA